MHPPQTFAAKRCHVAPLLNLCREALPLLGEVPSAHTGERGRQCGDNAIGEKIRLGAPPRGAVAERLRGLQCAEIAVREKRVRSKDLPFCLPCVKGAKRKRTIKYNRRGRPLCRPENVASCSNAKSDTPDSKSPCHCEERSDAAIRSLCAGTTFLNWHRGDADCHDQ